MSETKKLVMIDDRSMTKADEGDHHHLSYRCPSCGFPQTMCLKKNKLLFPDVINYRDQNHRCPVCSKKHHVNDILTPEAKEEYNRFNDIVLTIQLIKIPKFFYKRFKTKDRLYAISPEDKLQLTMDLRFHIDDITNLELKKHIYLNSTKLKRNEKVNWNKLQY